jgi:hypothetical protein
MQHKKFLSQDENHFVSWEVCEYNTAWDDKVHFLPEITIFDGDKAVYFGSGIESIRALIPELQAFIKEYDTVVKKHQSKPAKMKVKK